MDKGYDTIAIHEGCERRGVHPVVPFVQRGTNAQPPALGAEHGYPLSTAIDGADGRHRSSRLER